MPHNTQLASSGTIHSIPRTSIPPLLPTAVGCRVPWIDGEQLLAQQPPIGQKHDRLNLRRASDAGIHVGCRTSRGINRQQAKIIVPRVKCAIRGDIEACTLRKPRLPMNCVVCAVRLIS